MMVVCPIGWTMAARQCGIMSAQAATTRLGTSGPSNVDVDWFYGDATAWVRYATGMLNPTPLRALPSDQNIDNLARKIIAGDFAKGETRLPQALGDPYAQIQGRVNQISRASHLHRPAWRRTVQCLAECRSIGKMVESPS